MSNYGLIGKPLTHSFSKKYFTDKFSRENLANHQYELYEIDAVKDLHRLIESEKLDGLNVTIPFKEEVLRQLNEIEDTARAIGAVNTIKVERSASNIQLIGYNTDVLGFQQSIKPFLAPKHNRALIFGTGGASKAIAYVLSQLGINYFFVSRNPKAQKEISYEDLSPQSIDSFRFLINCTPIGTFPKVDEKLPIPYEAIGQNHLVYDLVYNPKETTLLKNAKSAGAIAINGLSMLQLQAEAAWKIWRKGEVDG